MLRWSRTYLAAVLGGFVLVGLIGLAEGASQWIRFDLLAGKPAAGGLVRVLGPHLVLYGWFGLLLSGLLFLPASLLSRWQARPRRFTITFALAGALACLVTIDSAYLCRAHLMPQWWEDHGSLLGRILMGMVGLVFLLAAWKPVRRLTDWMAHQKTRTLVIPLLVLIVATSSWPDWRQEGRVARTAHLERAITRSELGSEASHLVLLSIDTLRRDYLSLVDPEAPPTPNLDGLAKEGTLFSRVWSPSPWTLPSMGTIMTGKPPRVLGVGRYDPLPGGVSTLAEIAWTRGYRTSAFATNPYLTDWYGLDRGFESFEHSIVLETLRPAERSVLVREASRYAGRHFQANSAEFVIPKSIAWLRRNGAAGPFFLWVHLMNPHLPYSWRELPESARGENTPRGRQPKLDDVPEGGFFAGRSYRGVRLIREGEFVPDEREKQALRTLYAREVQFADHWVGRFLAELKRLKLWDRVVVVVVADHGEEFWEHDGFEHGHSVMPEVTRVPLIIRVPRGPAGAVVERPVSTLDLVPTLCDLLGWPSPPGLPGTSLMPLDRAAQETAQAGPPTPLILEDLLYPPQQSGVLAWPWLWVKTEGASSGSWFDLATDPSAVRPIPAPPAAASILARADSLRLRWDKEAETLPRGEAAGEIHVPENIKRALESLGY